MDRIFPAQDFASNDLNRSIAGRRDKNFIKDALKHAGTKILLVSGNQCEARAEGQGSSLRWRGLDDLPTGFHSSTGTLSYRSEPLAVVPFLLGQEGSCWKLAANVSSVLTNLKDLEFMELRSLLGSMRREELAVAGHAVALSQWHASSPFCSRCGAPNKQIEAGAKLGCTANEKHKFYPRTDPVAIMMIEDETGTLALLGRPKKLRNGVLTCLSGFIEQGESIEEAVRREVLEEAGVKVGDVKILGSQPWPIGRGGSCELMIGCIGKALGKEVHMDEDEMEEVRWVSKADVQAAISASSSGASYDSFNSTAPGLDFFIPPKWAIAHHLIKTWATSSEPWFSKL